MSANIPPTVPTYTFQVLLTTEVPETPKNYTFSNSQLAMGSTIVPKCLPTFSLVITTITTLQSEEQLLKSESLQVPSHGVILDFALGLLRDPPLLWAGFWLPLTLLHPPMPLAPSLHSGDRSDNSSP